MFKMPPFYGGKMLLVIGGIKGGSGKTTLATNLTVCRKEKRDSVLLIDADEQQSSLDWCHFRKLSSLPEIRCIKFYGKDLYEWLKKEKNNWSNIIIDTGAGDTTSQRASLAIADVFLVRFRPRSFDVWTLVSLKRLNREIRTVNSNLKIMSVLNQCDPKGSDPKTARKILEDDQIQCLQTQIGYRKAFSNASSEGKGIIEYKSSDEKSLKEIKCLHKEIYQEDML